MFLPDYLLLGLESARHDGHLLAHAPHFLYEAAPALPTPWYLSPALVFLVGAVCLTLLLWRTRNRRLLRGIALPFLLLTGIIGCLLVFLGYFTSHPTTAPNANLLWANPLNLFLAPWLLKKRVAPAARLYLRVYLCLLGMGLVLWPFLSPAVLHSSMIIILWMSYLAYRLQEKTSSTK
jgi:hypothetical protein